MKEITLKEWSAYLPYGLICEVKDQGRIEIDTLFGVYDSKELLFHNIVEFYQGFESVKPILYDLSWLTREITHEGETFIPIVELAKIGTREENCYIINSNNCQCYVDAECQKKGFFIYRTNGFFIWQVGKNGDPLTVWNQLQLFTKLFEWKFNVFNIPDELIVRVSEDFNPYK